MAVISLFFILLIFNTKNHRISILSNENNT